MLPTKSDAKCQIQMMNTVSKNKIESSEPETLKHSDSQIVHTMVRANRVVELGRSSVSRFVLDLVHCLKSRESATSCSRQQ